MEVDLRLLSSDETNLRVVSIKRHRERTQTEPGPRVPSHHTKCTHHTFMFIIQLCSSYNCVHHTIVFIIQLCSSYIYVLHTFCMQHTTIAGSIGRAQCIFVRCTNKIYSITWKGSVFLLSHRMRHFVFFANRICQFFMKRICVFVFRKAASSF